MMDDFITDNDDQVSGSRNSPPILPPESPGSSVSTRLHDEYSELLKYTVNSMTLNDEDLEAGDSFHQAPEAFEGLNSNNNKREETMATCSMADKRSGSTGSRRPSCVDSILAAMGPKLDRWLGTLKQQILEELTNEIMSAIEMQEKKQRSEINDLAAQKQNLEKEINKLSENVSCLEQSICRKDTLIENQTDVLCTQKDKVALAKKFYDWKACCFDKKREEFCETLANQHHESKVCQKVFKCWFGVVQGKWRCKVERSCQDQAQGVCVQLTNDYEKKISEMNDTISCLESKVSELLEEKEAYAEQVKKAFMRGVCALNIEAMSAFNPDHQQSETSFFENSSAACDMTKTQDQSNNKNNAAIYDTYKENRQVKSLPPEFTTASSDLFDSHVIKESSQPRSFPSSKLNSLQITSTRVKASSGTPTAVKTKQVSGSSRPKSQPQVLAPPMASVVVERHQPITKKTIGKATALRYPKKATKDGRGCEPQRHSDVTSPIGHHFKLLAGQTTEEDNINMMKTQALSIKVVD